MEGEIKNRVANSKLVTIDLDTLYPKGDRITIDISQWLFQGLIVREKEFRAQLKEHNWEQYKDKYVALYCSTDAIIPGWAYLLITTHLQSIAKYITQGTIEELDSLLLSEVIHAMDFSEFENKPVIINGCSNHPIPESSYLLLLQKLMPIARSIMYGEACSSVPLFKRSVKNRA